MKNKKVPNQVNLLVNPFIQSGFKKDVRGKSTKVLILGDNSITSTFKMLKLLEMAVPYISTLIDIGISYDSDSKSFWSFLCGEMSDIKIKVRSIEIPEDLLNKDYAKDRQFRDDLKNWLNQIWGEKDRFLSST